MVLGKARLAQTSHSAEHRLQAIWAFRRVVAAQPENREAWDLMGRAATLLGGADGERIASGAYERLLSLDPADPVAWNGWLILYRGRGERERMRRILARHDSVPEARARIARLFIEDERYPAAGELLDALLRDDPLNPAYLGLRAQGAFEAGDTARGQATYARALRYADRDAQGLLWSQVVGIASPEEIRAWEAGVPPAAREGFLTSFWARRNPDLFAGVNARVAEHFARLRGARKRFPLLHPLGAYHRSDTTRAAEIRPSAAEDAFYLYCEAQDWSGGQMRAADRARTPTIAQDLGYWTLWNEQVPIQKHRVPLNEGSPVDPRVAAVSLWFLPERFVRDKSGIQIPGQYPHDPSLGVFLPAPFGRSLQDVDTTAARAGYNLRTGLDDRGITYLRYGAPPQRVIGAPNVEASFCRVPDVERWDYPDIGPVRFFRPSAIDLGMMQGLRQTGDMVFRPQNAPQFGATVASLTRDATSAPATLEFEAWLAEFANPDDLRLTDIAVFSTQSVVAAQLVAAFEEPAPAVSDRLGLALLTARPGSYVLQVHAHAGDSLGRLERTVVVRDFSAGPKVSDLVVAPAWADTAVDRAAILARAARDLTFPPATPIRVYAELYGLPRASDGAVRYRVAYQLVRTGDFARDAQRDSLPGGTVLRYDRVHPFAGRTAIEWLDIVPGLVPRGQYLLRLTVSEPATGRVLGVSQIALEVRAQ